MSAEHIIVNSFPPLPHLWQEAGIAAKEAGASEDAANPAQLEAFLQIPRNAFFKTSGVWDIITPNENFCKVQCLVHWRASRLSWNKMSPQLKSTSAWTRSATVEVTVAGQGGRGMTLWCSRLSLCPDTPSSSQTLQQTDSHFHYRGLLYLEGRG